jgi:hypothetical protein
LKKETRVIPNYIRDVINYLKKGFSLSLYGIPKHKYPCDGGKAEKTKNW